MSNKTAAPKLRFPEFQDAPEWERKKLSELLFETKQRNRNLKYDKSDVLSVSGEYGCVNQIELLGRSYAGVSVKDYHVVETGDIVYTKSPLKKNPFGIIKENKGKPGIVSTLYAVYRTTNIANSTYLDHYFSGDYNLSSYLQPIVRKGAKNDMKVNNFAVLGGEILIPKIPEQQKIADCLTSLDDLIAAQSQKVETLQAYKKGLLQNLFPAEGESVPRLRFPEFQSAGEWATKEFSEYIVLYRGSSPRPIQEYLTKNDNGVNWIKIGDTKAADNYIINQVEEKITPKGAEKSRKVSSGELILANSMSFGKTYQLAIDGYIYDGWFVLREYKEHFHKSFLLQLLNSEYMQNQYIKLSAGGIVQNISSDIVYSTILPHTSLEEQQRIAELLTALDEQISAQGEALAALKVHKKGLMQGLFASGGGAG